jgi:hypothetical protein
MILYWRLAFLILVLATTTVQAETPHLSLGPHEHGIGQFNIVLDGNELMLELLAPAGDIVGFERLPVTVKERMAVRRVTAGLAKAERQFGLPVAAGCKLTASEVDGEQMEAIGHKHDHDHDHGHSNGGHDIHEHAEYHAVYRYTCRQPQALDQVEIKLFGHYKTLGKLRWQAVLPGGARAGELTPITTTLPLHGRQ